MTQDSTFAVTADERIDEIRHAGVRLAIAWIGDGDIDLAGQTMLASVLHQARIAGVGV